MFCVRVIVIDALSVDGGGGGGYIFQSRSKQRAVRKGQRSMNASLLSEVTRLHLTLGLRPVRGLVHVVVTQRAPSLSDGESILQMCIGTVYSDCIGSLFHFISFQLYYPLPKFVGELMKGKLVRFSRTCILLLNCHHQDYEGQPVGNLGDDSI